MKTHEALSIVMVCLVLGFFVRPTFAKFSDCYNKCYDNCVRKSKPVEFCIIKCLAKCTTPSEINDCAKTKCINISINDDSGNYIYLLIFNSLKL